MKQQVVVFWFRRDLRLHDNTGLYHALKHGLPLVPVFIFDKNILDKLEDKADIRVVFIHRHLEKINRELSEFSSALRVYHGEPSETWRKITGNYNITAVYANEDYEPYACKRDDEIKAILKEKNIIFHLYKDQVIFSPTEILKDNGTPYTVFTPYKNKWRSTLKSNFLKSFQVQKYSSNFYKAPNTPVMPLKKLGFKDCSGNFPGPQVVKLLIEKYALQRDYPAISGTSRLSVHLRFGTVSIRKLVSETLLLSETWVNELIWREFYMMILFHFPYVATGAFKPAYNNLKWRNNEVEFLRWCNGQTGYPIVDAGMRELNATGFMHNRLRMITAGFLTRHLLIDWRWGEAYFASKLLDFELSSNNGGWQWAAGTGCDAAPYFRIFNPHEQTRKFDPDFQYIRKWVPEFEGFSYPAPIVDHKMARERCLKMYKQVLFSGN